VKDAQKTLVVFFKNQDEIPGLSRPGKVTLKIKELKDL